MCIFVYVKYIKKSVPPSVGRENYVSGELGKCVLGPNRCRNCKAIITITDNDLFGLFIMGRCIQVPYTLTLCYMCVTFTPPSPFSLYDDRASAFAASLGQSRPLLLRCVKYICNTHSLIMPSYFWGNDKLEVTNENICTQKSRKMMSRQPCSSVIEFIRENIAGCFHRLNVCALLPVHDLQWQPPKSEQSVLHCAMSQRP